jgi:hypothetical protein
MIVRSLAEVCGFSDIETDWSRYKHATDSSIFNEIHEARTGRPLGDFRPTARLLFVGFC